MAKCKSGKVKRKIKGGRKMCLPKKRTSAPKKAASKRRSSKRRSLGGGKRVSVRTYFGIPDRPAGAKGWVAAKPCSEFDWVTNGEGMSTLADLDTETCKPLPCNLKAAVAMAKSVKNVNDLHDPKKLRVMRPCEFSEIGTHPGASKATEAAVEAAIPAEIKAQDRAMRSQWTD